MNALIRALKTLNQRTLVTLIVVGLLLVPTLVVIATVDLLPASPEAVDVVAGLAIGPE